LDRSGCELYLRAEKLEARKILDCEGDGMLRWHTF